MLAYRGCPGKRKVKIRIEAKRTICLENPRTVRLDCTYTTSHHASTKSCPPQLQAVTLFLRKDANLPLRSLNRRPEVINCVSGQPSIGILHQWRQNKKPFCVFFLAILRKTLKKIDAVFYCRHNRLHLTRKEVLSVSQLPQIPMIQPLRKQQIAIERQLIDAIQSLSGFSFFGSTPQKLVERALADPANCFSPPPFFRRSRALRAAFRQISSAMECLLDVVKKIATYKSLILQDRKQMGESDESGLRRKTKPSITAKYIKNVSLLKLNT